MASEQQHYKINWQYSFIAIKLKVYWF